MLQLNIVVWFQPTHKQKDTTTTHNNNPNVKQVTNKLEIKKENNHKTANKKIKKLLLRSQLLSPNVHNMFKYPPLLHI